MAPGDDDKSEQDIQKDDKVASSRAGADEDGSYVGQISSDDAIDAGQTGAEARSEQNRR